MNIAAIKTRKCESKKYTDNDLNDKNVLQKEPEFSENVHRMNFKLPKTQTGRFYEGNNTDEKRSGVLKEKREKSESLIEGFYAIRDILCHLDIGHFQRIRNDGTALEEGT